MRIVFVCNGTQVSAEAPEDMRALDLLRDILGLTGTKEGCGRGECGACTILLDGEPVNACLLYAPKLQGRSVVTIEGVSGPGGGLHP
ncbi:MAG TPA: 2Fe-2S iron-sulfur cluster-binding protein, partial [Spirochaetia bacterium]